MAVGALATKFNNATNQFFEKDNVMISHNGLGHFWNEFRAQRVSGNTGFNFKPLAYEQFMTANSEELSSAIQQSIESLKQEARENLFQINNYERAKILYKQAINKAQEENEQIDSLMYCEYAECLRRSGKYEKMMR